MLCLTSCATHTAQITTDKASTAANALACDEGVEFVPDPSPLPDITPWFERANAGDKSAQLVVSMMYRDRIPGVEGVLEGQAAVTDVDPKQEMLRWRDRAEDQGLLLAELVHRPRLEREIDKPWQTPEDQNALAWIASAARRGYPNAQLLLGLAYFNGIEGNAKREEGLIWIQRAAVQGLDEAQYQLAMFYELGAVVNDAMTQVDKARANTWFERAATQGHPGAQFVLALKYRDGIDVEPDQTQSQQWRDKSANAHLWSPLIDDEHFADFYAVCMLNYDDVSIGLPFLEECGGDGAFDAYDETLSESEREKRREERELDLRTRFSRNYAIHYGMAYQWLKTLAQNPKAVTARVLQAQTLVNDGCRGETVENPRDEAQNLLKNDVEQGNATALYAKAQLDASSCVDLDAEQNDACEKIFCDTWDLLTQAANAGSDEAQILIAKKYADYSTFPFEPCNANPTPRDLPKAYNEAQKRQDKHLAADIAIETAMCYDDGQKERPCALGESLERDDEKAKQWFQIAESLSDFLSPEDLGNLANDFYRQGKGPKAIQYYRQSLEHSTDDFYFGVQVRGILQTADMYRNGTNGVTPDPNEAQKWEKLAVFIVTTLPYDETKKLYQASVNAIQQLPAIENLYETVEKQIQQQKEQRLEETAFSQHVLEPCLAKPWHCAEIVTPFYEEASANAMRAITALTLAKRQQLDVEFILNTDFQISILYGRNDDVRDKLHDLSPVYRAIYNIPDASQTLEKLYDTWLLNQVPAACQTLYEANAPATPWETMLSQAQKAIQNDARLQKIPPRIDPREFYDQLAISDDR